MSDNVSNALMEQNMQVIQATLARLERLAVILNRKHDEHLLRFSAIEASILDAKDELESIIKVELGGQLGFFQGQVGHRLDEQAERLAALEASRVPPG